MKNSKNLSTRGAALASLVAFSKYDRYSNLEVSSALGRYSFSDSDRRLFTRLVYGVIEKSVTLDSIISEYSSRPLSDIDTTTLCCVRLGIYQLLFSDKIPDHAAVSETVNAAPGSSKAFVNAVLRQFLRNGKKYTVPTDTTGRLSVTYSFPRELCRFFIDAYGEKTAERILAGFSERRPVYVRVNTLVSSADELIKDTFEGGRVCEASSDMIACDRISFDAEDARCFVEDLSSRLAVTALGAKKGEIVVDTCAAPGGKSFSAAIDMENTGKVFSFDLHENKVSLIRKGAERLGIGIIEAGARDARDPDEKLIGKADRVLCDAPCSGLGVISKKPDIKYKSLDDIKRLPDVQLSVLTGAAKYVKYGGVLVYSTCTLNPAENEGVAGRFLLENPEFEACDFTFSPRLKSENGMLTIFPWMADSDGFFISKFRRKTKD